MEINNTIATLLRSFLVAQSSREDLKKGVDRRRYEFTLDGTAQQYWDQFLSELAEIPEIQELMSITASTQPGDTPQCRTLGALHRELPHPGKIADNIYNEYWHSSFLGASNIVSAKSIATLRTFEDKAGYYHSLYYVKDGRKLIDTDVTDETTFIMRLALCILTETYASFSLVDCGDRLDSTIYFMRAAAQLLEHRKSLVKLCGLDDLSKKAILKRANKFRAIAGELVRLQSVIDSTFKNLPMDTNPTGVIESWDFSYRTSNGLELQTTIGHLGHFINRMRLLLVVAVINTLMRSYAPHESSLLMACASLVRAEWREIKEKSVNTRGYNDEEEDVFMQ